MPAVILNAKCHKQILPSELPKAPCAGRDVLLLVRAGLMKLYCLQLVQYIEPDIHSQTQDRHRSSQHIL